MILNTDLTVSKGRENAVLKQQLFEKHFTLDEAASLLPFVKQTFERAQGELAALRDDIILYKRMHQVMEEEGPFFNGAQPNQIVDVLQHKWHCYEECFYRWVNLLADKGIQVRDFKKGLIDFPYQARDGSEYFLCWHLGEEDLFYFHDVYEGFAGRKPISLLPK